MKKMTLYFLVMVMVVFLSACSSKEIATNADEKLNSSQVSNDVSTENPAVEPTEAPTPEPTEAPTPEPTEAPTPEPTEAPTPEPTEAPTPEPAEAPTPETVSGTVKYSGTLTLPSGATIPVLDKFNTEGIDFYSTFWGVPDTDESNAAMKVYMDAIEGVRETWSTLYSSKSGSQNFTYDNYSMKFYLEAYYQIPSIEIVRDGICYTLWCAVPFDTEIAHRIGKYDWDDNDTARAKEALICILASVTSTPNELAEEILKLLYEDTSAIPDDYTWGVVGDAKVSVYTYNFNNGNHNISFLIEPK